MKIIKETDLKNETYKTKKANETDKEKDKAKPLTAWASMETFRVSHP